MFLGEIECFTPSGKYYFFLKQFEVNVRYTERARLFVPQILYETFLLLN